MLIPPTGSHALAAAALFLSLSATAEPISPARFLPISHSVVRVTAEHGPGKVSVGSGVTVAPSIVATSCHVVRDASDIQVGGRGGMWAVDAEYADVRRDVCLLRVPSWEGKAVDLAADSNDLAAGATVVALGFTGGVAITPRFGHVRALHDFDGGRVIEADAPFNSGSSGGGLFDDEGALVGLLTFRLRNSEMSYYSVPVAWVREQLAANPEWTAVRPLHEGGLPFWQGETRDLPAFMRAEVAHVMPTAENPPQ